MAVTDVETKALTCEQVAAIYSVANVRNIQRMCLRAATLARRYGGWSKVPELQKKTALNGKKVGKSWFVPVSEAQRIFLP